MVCESLLLPQTNMTSRENKKKAIIWFIVIMIINWSLLACAFVKTLYEQNDTALVFIMIFLIANVIGYIKLKRLPRD